MIDIHCHILPGIDDGPQTMDESVEMAKLAESNGVHTIIATPHHQNGKYLNVKEDILSGVTALNHVLQSHSIDVTILPGQETRLYGEIVAGLHNGEILSLNDKGKYFFIELPFEQVPRYTTQVLYDAQLQGYTPILVHPERNQELLERPEMLYRFVKNGALTQITTASLLGHFGTKVKKFTDEIIKANLTHFLASDAHNTRKRSFYLQEAIAYVEKKHGRNYVNQWVENAELISEGRYPIIEPPEPVKRNKILHFLQR